MTTLKDVAKMAGVSISTVSRILNNDSTCKISEETREKVFNAVNELNYIPNQTARELVKRGNPKKITGSNVNIACLFGDEVQYTDTYFTSILLGIESKIREYGYALSIFGWGSNDQNSSIFYNALNRNFTAVILMEDQGAELLDKMKGRIKHVVSINGSFSNYDCVSYNMFEAAESAVKYLVDKGHRRIAYIGGSEGNTDYRSEKRYKGYLNVLRDAGIPEDISITRDGKWDTYLSYLAMKEILETKPIPTALFAACDMTAVGAMRAINEAGLKIPDDIAVFSIDNIEMSEYTYPPLSTIDVPKKEMGEVAVQMLAARINGDTSLPKHVILPTRKIIRASSG